MKPPHISRGGSIFYTCDRCFQNLMNYSKHKGILCISALMRAERKRGGGVFNANLSFCTVCIAHCTLHIQTVQKVVFFYVKPYCAALERRGNFGSKSYLGAWSRKMPLFQKQSAGLFLKFTPKRAGACLRRLRGAGLRGRPLRSRSTDRAGRRDRCPLEPRKPFEKGLTEN